MIPGDTPVKMTKDAKAMIQMAFEDLGGLPRLVLWANETPGNLSAFYTQIWSKIIPRDVKADFDGSITIEIQKFEAPLTLDSSSSVKASSISNNDNIDDAIINQAGITAAHIAVSEGLDDEA